MDLFSIDKEITANISQLKEQLTTIDYEINQRDERAVELKEDIEKLTNKLKLVNFQLERNYSKADKADDQRKEIYLFYEKLVENTRNLNSFVMRQNTFLEKQSFDNGGDN